MLRRWSFSISSRLCDAHTTTAVMLYTRLLPYASLFAVAANAQATSDLILGGGSTSTTSSSASTSGSTSGSSSGSSSTVPTSGLSEPATPTGSYISYSSTITIEFTTSSSAITTSAILSTITSGSTTETTTLGSTTIFGYSTEETTSNVTSSTTAPTTSQLLLSGSFSATSTVTLNSTSSTSTQPAPSATCNNYPQFCTRKYGNITEVSAHNSPFIKSGNAAANQDLSVTAQLNDGIRLLQGQVHFNGSVPHFCHTSCDVLDAGPITEYLGLVYNWVSSHPFDVVTILIGNGDYKPVEQFVPFLQQTGLVKFAYTPPKIPMGIDDWPTLSQFILTGKRVLFFMDYQANQTSVPWIMDEFSQMWETPFDPTDRSFPCTVQRPPNLSPQDAKNRMYLMNHNLNYDINILGNSLLVPNFPLLNITNNITGYGSLGSSTQNCENMWGFPPKFLNVDYYNVGNGSVFEVAAMYNNVTYNRTCCGLPTSGSMKLETAGRSATFGLVLVVLSWMFL